ncbi:hypothetical protein Tco_1430127 [Tanacetum coccineum]
MAREAELKKQRVFNTGNGVAKPVWNNANRVNRANHFVPRPVQLNAVRSNVNTGRANVNTGRANVNTVRANVNSVRQNVNSVRTNINTVRSKQPVPTNNTNSFSPVRPQDHPLKNMEDKGIFDSGCSGHMTGAPTHTHEAETRHMLVDDLFQLVPQLMTRISLEKDLKQTKQTMGNAIVKLVNKVKKMEKGRNLQKDKSEVFETPKQGKSSGETDISPQGLEAVETLAEALSQIKTKRRNVKTGVRRRLDAEDVSTGFKNVKYGFTVISLLVKKLVLFYTEEDWDIIRAKLEANAYLVKEIAGEDISEADYAQRMVGLIKFVPMDTEKESRKRTGEVLQTESSKKLKSDTREDVSISKEKDKNSVKKEEGFEIKKPVLRYTKRKSLGRKGLQKKPESAKSGTEEDVEAYMEERVDEPSSEEFLMGSISQGPAPAKIVKWQIIKTGKRGAYQIIREDNTDVVYVNFKGLLNDLTRDDLKKLYRLMMLKYGDNRPEEEFERSTMSNRHKDWLVQEQTALGKEFSNPFMADNLPNIVWLSTHHIYEAHNEDIQRNLKFTSEDQVRGGLLGIIVNRLKSGSIRNSYLRDILGDILGKDLLKGTHSGAKMKNLNNIVLTSNTPYPSRKIWRLCVCTSQETIKTYTPYPRALIRQFYVSSVLGRSIAKISRRRAEQAIATSDKDRLEKAKEDNIMQYEEKLKVSFVDNEGINGERGECKDW